MVSSSVNPLDIKKAKKINQITDYIIKPIKLDDVKGVIDDFYTASLKSI